MTPEMITGTGATAAAGRGVRQAAPGGEFADPDHRRGERPAGDWPRTGPVRVGVYYPRIRLGGAEVWLSTLLAALPPARCAAVGVAVDDDRGREVPMPCPVTGDVGAVASAADVVIAWGVSSLGPVRRHFAGPVVCVSHGGCGWTRHMLSRIAPDADAFAAVSRHAASAYPSGLRPRVRVIPCGVAAVPLPDRAAARRGLGTAGRPAVGYVGRVSDEKDPTAAARAAAKLPGAAALYCGPDLSGGRLEAEVRSLLPVERLIWLGGRAAPAAAFAAVDCLVHTSPSEGFGLAVAEAMLGGVPVVCTRTGFVAELEEDVAVTVPTGAGGAELADAVRAAVSDPARVARARRVVAARYGVDAAARAWADLLTDAAAAFGRGPRAGIGRAATRRA